LNSKLCCTCVIGLYTPRYYMRATNHTVEYLINYKKHFSLLW